MNRSMQRIAPYYTGNKTLPKKGPFICKDCKKESSRPYTRWNWNFFKGRREPTEVDLCDDCQRKYGWLGD